MIRRPPRSTLLPYTTLFRSPPFDMAYITATHLLELAQAQGTLVVNDPPSVRNAPQKLFVLEFAEIGRATSELQSRQYLASRLLLETTPKQSTNTPPRRTRPP